MLPRNFSLVSDLCSSCSAREGLQPIVPGAPWVIFRSAELPPFFWFHSLATHSWLQPSPQICLVWLCLFAVGVRPLAPRLMQPFLCMRFATRSVKQIYAEAFTFFGARKILNGCEHWDLLFLTLFSGLPYLFHLGFSEDRAIEPALTDALRYSPA